jgi:hypothetical protein
MWLMRNNQQPADFKSSGAKLSFDQTFIIAGFYQDFCNGFTHDPKTYQSKLHFFLLHVKIMNQHYICYTFLSGIQVAQAQ